MEETAAAAAGPAVSSPGRRASLNQKKSHHSFKSLDEVSETDSGWSDVWREDDDSLEDFDRSNLHLNTSSGNGKTDLARIDEHDENSTSATTTASIPQHVQVQDLDEPIQQDSDSEEEGSEEDDMWNTDNDSAEQELEEANTTLVLEHEENSNKLHQMDPTDAHTTTPTTSGTTRSSQQKLSVLEHFLDKFEQENDSSNSNSSSSVGNYHDGGSSAAAVVVTESNEDATAESTTTNEMLPVIPLTEQRHQHDLSVPLGLDPLDLSDEIVFFDGSGKEHTRARNSMEPVSDEDEEEEGESSDGSAGDEEGAGDEDEEVDWEEGDLGEDEWEEDDKEDNPSDYKINRDDTEENLSETEPVDNEMEDDEWEDDEDGEGQDEWDDSGGDNIGEAHQSFHSTTDPLMQQFVVSPRKAPQLYVEPQQQETETSPSVVDLAGSSEEEEEEEEEELEPQAATETSSHVVDLADSSEEKEEEEEKQAEQWAPRVLQEPNLSVSPEEQVDEDSSDHTDDDSQDMHEQKADQQEQDSSSVGSFKANPQSPPPYIDNAKQRNKSTRHKAKYHPNKNKPRSPQDWECLMATWEKMELQKKLEQAEDPPIVDTLDWSDAHSTPTPPSKKALRYVIKEYEDADGIRIENDESWDDNDDDAANNAPKNDNGDDSLRLLLDDTSGFIDRTAKKEKKNCLGDGVFPFCLMSKKKTRQEADEDRRVA